MAIRCFTVALAYVLSLCIHTGAAAPTWPSSVDELEDIMLLNTGYRAKGFANPVTPCNKGAGPGRVAAAEYIRTAFHDMATGNIYQGTGGLDASIVFELGGDNPGPGFPTTLTTFEPYLSARSSMADLIAMGVYTSVRSCGGPAVPMRAGRVDATEAGPPGVPQPQNSLFTFQNQFGRMGFDTTQMISVVACGHTLGGVHTANFPQIVPAGSSPNDFKAFDSTGTTKFDEKIASEYVSGTTTDPLTVGPAQSVGRASDLRVFTADGNATITSMADPATFASTCQALLQKMVEVVPSGVTLSDVITPYDVKPVALQLTLQGGGNEILFSGEIRVRTTTRPASQISSVQLVYKDRTGGSDCGGCRITTAPKGTAAGFDDSFTVRSPATSANLVLSLKVPRSNVVTPALQSQTVALTRESTVGPYNIVTGTYTLDSAQVQTTKFDITSGQASDSFKSTGDLGTACVPLDSTSPSSTSFPSSTISSSSSSSSSKPTTLQISTRSTSTTMTSTTPSTPSTPAFPGYSYQGCYTDSVSARVLTGRRTETSTMSYQSCSTFCNGFPYFGLEHGSECFCGQTLSNPTGPAPESDCSMKCSGDGSQVCGAGNRLTLFKSTSQGPSNPAIAGWTYDACYTDSTSARVLTGKYVPDSALTVEKCAAACKGYQIFGTQYRSQCYCGNAFAGATAKVAETQCGYVCAGNALQFCGAGNRLSVYRANA
ncbi:MAG: hypothetical protein LQ344_003562 [Seirophora lacunosa]|nr:MAG: hypothetical protein LQ344_003562 [Seirophora lacunosa]